MTNATVDIERLNKIKAEVERNWRTNARRIARVLRGTGIQSRADLLSRYDKGSDYQDIKGIGPRLGYVLRAMIREYPPAEWEAATEMPWDDTKEQANGE